MIARNPHTGGQIRVMKSEVSIWKDTKTLVWMKEPFCETLTRWKRWDIVVAGVDPTLLAWKPDIVVLTENTSSACDWLKTPQAKATRFILMTMTLVTSLAKDGFDVSTLGNILCVEEYASVYPFIGSPWDGTVEDAIVCASVVFRYNRVIGIPPGHPRMTSLALDKVNLDLVETSSPPEPLVLIQQYYNANNSIRQDELYKCLKNNLESPYIDTILLFVESKNITLPPDPYKKLVTIPLKTRITYSNCIEAIQSRLGPGYIVVFANADIYLDDSWKSVWSVNLHDTFLALLRWEEGDDNNPHTIFGPRADSQDTWVIHSDSVMDRKWSLNNLNIPFGQAGCDNAICIEFLRHKFKIVNPSWSLKTIHVHKSEIRNYDPKNIVDRSTYMFIEPSGLHELHPVTEWNGWASELIPHDSLDRPLRATNPKALSIFCSQMNRDESFIWSADGPNTYMTPYEQDHKIKMTGGAFVSPNGLVYRHTDICVGSTMIQKEMWSSNTLSHLTPAHGVNDMFAIPLQTEWVHDPALYTLNYLSRLMKLRDESPEASFWCKRTEGHLAVVKLFKWSISRGRLLEYDDNTQVFAKNVYGRSAHGLRILPDEIQALRESLLSDWVSVPDSSNSILFVIDILDIKDSLLDELQNIAVKEGLSLRIITSHSSATQWEKALSGVSRVVLSSSVKKFKVSTWAWMWLAPKGCKILELQEEREPSDSLLHLCAASGLEWTLLQYPRSTPNGFKKIIMNEFKKWFVTIETKPSLPILYTPYKSMKFGFFGHSGDSFRELIDLWSEKGYIERREDSSLTHCWLNAVGSDGILLYDRPTWEWLEKAPEKEKTFSKCLTGNPIASEKPLCVPWIFWARHPKLVEDLAPILSQRKFIDRTDSLVFFGRVENSKQGEWRTDISGWQSLCSKFSMPIGAKQPYAFSPKEYLEALSNSRYGLCLRGYGPKCNREIELLAVGTVPVIVNGVDTESYSDPLIEGVHYLRVSDPDNARDKIACITESEWTAMSKAGYDWWMRNASVEGSWSRTCMYAKM